MAIKSTEQLHVISVSYYLTGSPKNNSLEQIPLIALLHIYYLTKAKNGAVTCSLVVFSVDVNNFFPEESQSQRL